MGGSAAVVVRRLENRRSLAARRAATLLFSGRSLLSRHRYRELSPFELDPIQLLQHEVRAFVGDIHEGLAVENLDASHDFLGHARDACDHAHEISGCDLVGVAKIEGQPNHSCFM